MRIKRVAFYFVFFVVLSCGVKKEVTTNIESAVKIEFRKMGFETPVDTLKSPYYRFSVVALSDSDIIGFERLNLNALNLNSNDAYPNEIYSDKPIRSIRELQRQSTKKPYFVIENQDNEFKYYFDVRKFQNDVVTLVGDQKIKQNGPTRSINYLGGHTFFEENIDLVGDQEYILDEINLYQYDLKINLNDEKVRLHYVWNYTIHTSNWINVEEKTERLDKLFNY